jgi:hypothetical protein
MPGHGYIPLDPTLQYEPEPSAPPTQTLQTTAPKIPVVKRQRGGRVKNRREASLDANFRLNPTIRNAMTAWMTMHPEIATMSEGYRSLLWHALENMHDDAAFASGFREGIYRATKSVTTAIASVIAESPGDRDPNWVPPPMPQRPERTERTVPADAMQMNGFVDEGWDDSDEG